MEYKRLLLCKLKEIDAKTIAKYLEYMEDAFMIERSVRYDIKGRRYIDTPYKYYFEDLGLRNARIGFRRIVIAGSMQPTCMNDNGILFVNVLDFLLEPFKYVNE